MGASLRKLPRSGDIKPATRPDPPALSRRQKGEALQKLLLTSSGLLGGSRVQGLGHEGMEKKLRTIQSLLYDVLSEASRVALQQPKGGTNCF